MHSARTASLFCIIIYSVRVVYDHFFRLFITFSVVYGYVNVCVVYRPVLSGFYRQRGLQICFVCLLMSSWSTDLFCLFISVCMVYRSVSVGVVYRLLPLSASVGSTGLTLLALAWSTDDDGGLPICHY